MRVALLACSPHCSHAGVAGVLLTAFFAYHEKVGKTREPHRREKAVLACGARRAGENAAHGMREIMRRVARGQ